MIVSSYFFALLSLFQVLDARFPHPLSSWSLHTFEVVTAHWNENCTKRRKEIKNPSEIGGEILILVSRRRIDIWYKVTLMEYFGGNLSLSFWQRKCIRRRKRHETTLRPFSGGVQVSVWTRTDACYFVSPKTKKPISCSRFSRFS